MAPWSSLSNLNPRRRPAIRAWQEMLRSERPNDLVLQDMSLNGPALNVLNENLSKLDISDRLQTLCLREIKVEEKEETQAAVGLAQLLLLNRSTLRKISLGYLACYHGWRRQTDVNVFFRALHSHEQPYQALEELFMKNLNLQGELVGRSLEMLLSEAPSLRHMTFRLCLLDTAMFAHVSNGLQRCLNLEVVEFNFLPTVYVRGYSEATLAVCEPILTSLSQMNSLRDVTLCLEGIESDTALELLSNLLKHNQWLESLAFRLVELFNNVVPTNPHFQEFVSQALRKHPSLHKLDLAGCKIGNDIVDSLFQALETNRSLQHLWLPNTRNNHHLTCRGAWVECLPRLRHLRTLGLPDGIQQSSTDPSSLERLLDALRRNWSLTRFEFYVPPTEHARLESTPFKIQSYMLRNRLFQRIETWTESFSPAVYPWAMKRVGQGDPHRDHSSLVYALLQRLPIQ